MIVSSNKYIDCTIPDDLFDSSRKILAKSKSSMREKCPYSEFLWSAFSGIQTECCIQSDCGKIRTKKLRIGTLFMQ